MPTFRQNSPGVEHAQIAAILRQVPDTTLHTQEAVLLAHALIARLAESVDARVLFIKGPTAVALGARPDRPSSDVDVLVDPPAFQGICRGLEAGGWRLRTPIGRLHHAADLAFDHSAHYIHPQWPCDLDVHYLFPGFLAPPEQVFDALWDRRTEVTLAGQPLPTPDLLGQALVVGLHALRDPGLARSQADLHHLAQALSDLSKDDCAALGQLASDTGSTGSARELLERVRADVPAMTDEDLDRLMDWRLRQEGFGLSTIWLAELQRAPWRQRPAALRRALLPPREHLLSSHLAPTASRSAVAVMHVRRWLRGLLALPHAARVLVRRQRQLRAAQRR
jgi:hypothetical protein